MKKHIPNFLTSLNLFCGCIAIVMIFRNRLEMAAYLVLAAAIFDFFDGFAARMLKVHSPMGKELDSLADVVTFGLVPGAILFTLFQSVGLSMFSGNESAWRFFQFFPFIVTVFSALRLAKFNIDTRQSESFIGMPTPAATIFVIALPLILKHDNFNLSEFILNPYFIIGLSILISYLLVAEIPLIALKFKTFSFKENSYQYILLIAAVILVLFLLYAAIPIIIFLYLLLSIIKNSTKKTA